jgi:hypothetical protein
MSGFTRQSMHDQRDFYPNHQAVRAEAATVKRIVQALRHVGSYFEAKVVEDWLLKKRAAEAAARNYLNRTNGNPTGTRESAHCENILAKAAVAVFAEQGIDGVKWCTENSIRQVLRDYETEKASRMQMPRQFPTVAADGRVVVQEDSRECDSEDEWEIDSNFEPTDEERAASRKKAEEAQEAFFGRSIYTGDRNRQWWESGGS